MKTKLNLIVILLITTFALHSELKVATILGDNMVLQQNSDVNLWGKANPKQKIVIFTGWNMQNTKTIANEKGEWTAKVKTTEAGGPFTILISTKNEKRILNNILLGEVWLCSGQSNMEMPVIGFQDQPINNSNEILMEADNKNIRLFKVGRSSVETPNESCTGNWTMATPESVSQFSAIGYLYAKLLQQKLNVPVGIICSSWGGSRIEAWMNKETIAKFPNALAQTTYEKTPENQRATVLYNGMISPIKNFNIKGVIWYQGESNIINYNEYAELMQAMVAQWRKDFNVGQFPFYFVEIAPYSYLYPGSLNSALQREAQLKAATLIPNSRMISTIDLGDKDLIHPSEKLTIAKRLSYCSLSDVYAVNWIEYKTPTFKSMEIKDSVAILSFDNVALGLSTFGKKVNCMEIAGADHVFYPAQISISEMKLKVWSQNVINPVSVKYAFSNFPLTEGYLYNTAGLPVPSFRTDK